MADTTEITDKVKQQTKDPELLFSEDEDQPETKEEEAEEKKPFWITKPMADDFDRETLLGATIKAALIFVVFLILLITCTLRRRHSMSFYFSDALKAQFARKKFATNGTVNPVNIVFDKIKTATDVWSVRFIKYVTYHNKHKLFSDSKYTQTLLLDSLYWDYYYDDEHPVKPTDADDRKVLYENELLGVPRIRQVKVRNDSCVIHEYFRRLFLGCYDLFYEKDEDRDPFGKMHGTAWVYNNASVTKSIGYSAILSYYGGGGFYQDLSRNRTETRALIDDLFDNLWITKGTRAIFIDFSLYNGNMDLYAICKIIFEFSPTGGVVPNRRFVIMFLDTGKTAQTTFIIECLVYAFGVFYLMEEIRELCYFKLRYFRQFWSYMDLFLIAMILGNFMTSLVLFPNLTKTVERIINNPAKYGNMEEISYMKRLNEKIFAALVFFSLAKCFQYVNINRSMGQLNNTLKQCVGDILCFTVMFFIIFCAYAELAYLLFGSQVLAFSSFSVSMLSLLRTILGDFDYTQIEEANRFLAPVFFLSYIFLVFFVLLNMFLAIINDTYSDVKTEIAIAPDEMQMTEYLHKNFMAFIKWLGLNVQVDEKERKAQEVVQQIRESFTKCGFKDADIKMFFDRINPDSKLKAVDLVQVIEKRAADVAKKYGDRPFVEINDFLVRQSRLDRIDKNLKLLAEQLQIPISKIENVLKQKYGAA